MENSEINILHYLEKELLHKNLINKELDRETFSKVDVIGFDIDHTLCLYNTESLIEILYTSFTKYLVEHKNYPKELLISSGETNDSNYKFELDFVHMYSGTELIIDIPNGNVIKLDSNHCVIKAYHGTDELKQSDLEKLYGTEKTFSEFNFESKGTENYQLIVGNFELHVIPIFLIAVHLFDQGSMKYLSSVIDYKTIYIDIMLAVEFNYNLYDKENNCIRKIRESGYFFPELVKNPKKYLLDYSSKDVLLHMRSLGLKVFFATNSYYEYADFIMRNTIGDNYLDYFDVGFYYCMKPSFFIENKNNNGFFIDSTQTNNKSNDNIIINADNVSQLFDQIMKKKEILQGNYRIVEEIFNKLLNKDCLKFIYIGDSFYSDCHHSSKLKNWDCIAVSEYVSTGFIGNNPKDFKKFWNVEVGNFTENVFFTKTIRDHTLFTLPNVDALKYFK